MSYDPVDPAPTNVVPLKPSTDSGIHTTLTEEEDLEAVEAPIFSDDENAMLESILGGIDLSKMQPHYQPTPEEIQAQADATEAARSYDTIENNERVLNEVAALRAQIGKVYESIEAHLTAEWNKAIVSDDANHQEFLIKSEAPRWLQMARSDFQIALMKMDRSLTKTQGL